MNYPTAIVATGGLALALVAVPVQFESGDLLPSKSIALADKGGNPNGGNNSDFSNAIGGDFSNAIGGGGNGPSTGGGWAFGAGGHTSHIVGHPGNSSSIASLLKGLNAAHANQNALANTPLNSRVGLLAAYLGIATTPQDLAELTALRDAAQAALDAAGGGGIPANASLVAALAAAQADLDAALADIAALAPIDAVDLAAAQAVVAAQLALSLAGGAIPANALLVAALTAAQAVLAAELADNEAAALDAATKDNVNITIDSEVIDRVRALLGLPPI